MGEKPEVGHGLRSTDLPLGAGRFGAGAERTSIVRSQQALRSILPEAVTLKDRYENDPQYGDWSTRALMRELVQRLYPRLNDGTSAVEDGFHTSIRLGDRHLLALGVDLRGAAEAQAEPIRPRRETARTGGVRLTRTQTEVLGLYSAGHRVSEIAAKRGCSEETVRNHLKECRRIFGVHRSDDAAAAARHIGII